MMSSVTLVSITLAAVIALAVGLLIGFALQKKLHQNKFGSSDADSRRHY